MLELLTNALPQLTARLHELHWLTTNAKLVSAEPAGEGNMNRTLRVHTDGEPATLILKQSVPFVAKYPDIPAPIERASAEASFYEAIKATNDLNARTPTLLGYDSDNYLLAFEDLGAGSDQIGLYEQTHSSADIQQLTAPLISWISALHAITPQPLENRAMRQLNQTHIFTLPLQTDTGLDHGELVDIANSFANDQALITRAGELGAIYLGEASHQSDPALLHGDFYPGSWLTDNQGATRVIDAEFCFVGPAEFDLGVMLAHLIFAGLSLQQAQQICASYQPPNGFEGNLRDGFAGMEVIRRLLGVAQLPLAASAAQKQTWLHQARDLVLGGAA